MPVHGWSALYAIHVLSRSAQQKGFQHLFFRRHQNSISRVVRLLVDSRILVREEVRKPPMPRAKPALCDAQRNRLMAEIKASAFPGRERAAGSLTDSDGRNFPGNCAAKSAS